MHKYIQIYWTTGCLDEARRISRMLVQEKLVACANIIPGIESIFVWEGKVETSQEAKVIFKTRENCFDAVKKLILKNAEYEVPEIIKVPILGGHQEYLDWVDASTEPIHR